LLTGQVTVHQVSHFPADLSATITAAKTVRQFIAHLTCGLKLHAVHHAKKEMQQNVETFAWWKFGDSSQGFVKLLFAIGVGAHESDGVNLL
jgi:hypothetical protein